MSRQRATERLRQNRRQQDAYVNQGRKPPRAFDLNSLVFVRKQAQSTGKLDSCMRGPYRIVKTLPQGRYELQLLAGSYGKYTQAAAEYMIPWRGEWTPEVCAAYFDDADHEDEESTLELILPADQSASQLQPGTSGTQAEALQPVEPLQLQVEPEPLQLQVEPEPLQLQVEPEPLQLQVEPEPLQLQVEPEPLQLHVEPEPLQLHVEPEGPPANVELSMPVLETDHQS